MKIQNPLKLIIKFIGGGLINFPTRHIRWIKVEPDNGGDIPSGDTTIDDVVKFMHDALESYPGLFPYTTWDSIPNFEDVNSGMCKTDNPANRAGLSSTLLSIPQYIIGQKMGDSHEQLIN
jgi:hypothetical protein